MAGGVAEFNLAMLKAGHPERMISIDQGQGQSVTGYLINTLKSFDPRTRTGALNWAATFMPGPRGTGGRMGGLSPQDRALMGQLRNYASTRVARPGGGGGRTYRPINALSPMDYTKGVGPGQVVPGSHLHTLANKLGYNTGSPYLDIMDPMRLSRSRVSQSGLHPGFDPMEGRTAQLGLAGQEPLAASHPGTHPGQVGWSYPKVGEDEGAGQLLINMLMNIEKGRRNN